MTRHLLVAAGAALLLAGCQSAPETRVTRFHLNQPIARGDIAVEPLLPQDRGSLEFQSYANIVGAELARLGFTEAPGLRASEQVAVVGVERGIRQGPPRGSGLSIGLGAGGFGGGGYHGGTSVGGGAGVSFPVGRSRPNEIVQTRLTVQIKRRSDSSVIWEGRAETALRASSAEAEPTAVVQRLASRLFQGFPGESGRTIAVK